MVTWVVNPIVWILSSFAIVAVALVAFLHTTLGEYEEAFRANPRVLWRVFYVALAVSALNAVSVMSGGVCPGSLIHPDCQGGWFFKAK
ncbi:MAG: hypothetical protein VB131_10175 [Burkholderia gladioli]